MIDTFIKNINTFIVNPIIGFVFALAFVFFLWGIVEYFWNPDSESARTKGRLHMIWGIIGMFIMFAVFAIMRIIANTLGVDIDIPR